MRSHPVSGNSGWPRLLGMTLGLVEGGGEGICACWAAATSAAWTLGNEKQKDGGQAL